MKYCTNCGHELTDEAVFCENCGKAVERDQMPAFGEEAQSAENVYQAPQSPEMVGGAYQYAQPVNEQPQPVNEEHFPPYQQQPQQGEYYTPPQGAPAQNNPPQGAYYAPPQGMPQQQPYNTFEYTGPAAQPDEEKASVGLAILSFFIPLVGLIIFLTKKDTRPKTAKASGIAALVGVALSVIFSIIGTIGSTAALKNMDNYETDDIFDIVDSADEDDAFDGNIWGIFDETAYKNERFDMQYTLPEGFAFESYDAIIGEDTDYQREETSGVPMIVDGDVIFYYDSRAVNNNTGAFISTAVVPESESLKDSYDENAVLDDLVGALKASSENCEVSDYTYEFVGSHIFSACETTIHYDGYDGIFNYYVYEDDGDYMIVFIATNSQDDKTVQDYLSCFTSLD